MRSVRPKRRSDRTSASRNATPLALGCDRQVLPTLKQHSAVHDERRTALRRYPRCCRSLVVRCRQWFGLILRPDRHPAVLVAVLAIPALCGRMRFVFRSRAEAVVRFCELKILAYGQTAANLFLGYRPGMRLRVINALRMTSAGKS